MISPLSLLPLDPRVNLAFIAGPQLKQWRLRWDLCRWTRIIDMHILPVSDGKIRFSFRHIDGWECTRRPTGSYLSTAIGANQLHGDVLELHEDRQLKSETNPGLFFDRFGHLMELERVYRDESSTGVTKVYNYRQESTLRPGSLWTSMPARTITTTSTQSGSQGGFETTRCLGLATGTTVEAIITSRGASTTPSSSLCSQVQGASRVGAMSCA